MLNYKKKLSYHVDVVRRDSLPRLRSDELQADWNRESRTAVEETNIQLRAERVNTRTP
jgi:hypothetical protein